MRYLYDFFYIPSLEFSIMISIVRGYYSQGNYLIKPNGGVEIILELNEHYHKLVDCN